MEDSSGLVVITGAFSYTGKYTTRLLLDPNKDRQCACLCSIASDYQKCIKDCKDGCLASSFSAVESCQCLCNKGKENGTLNSFEAWVCKQMCKRNLK